MKKLGNPDFQEEIFFNRESFTSLVIENPVFYRQVRTMLHDQCLGDPGKFVFFDGDKEKPLSKAFYLIENPLHLDLDEKKLNLLLQKDIASHVTVTQKEEYQILLSKIGEYIRSISYDSPVPVEFDYEMTLSTFLKSMSVSAMEEENSFLESLLNQIRRISVLLGISLFAFVGLEDLLTIEERQAFVHGMWSQECDFFFLSSHAPKVKIQEEKVIVIDSDLAELSY